MSKRYFYCFCLLSFCTFLILTSCNKKDDEPLQPTGSWEFVGLENISIHKIIISGNNIYAATEFGIFRNNVESLTIGGWHVMGLASRAVLDLVVFNDLEILAATQQNQNDDISLNLTTDGGDTWEPYQQGFGGDGLTTVRALAIHPANPDILFARGDYVVARSMDRGQSWAPVFGEWDLVGYQAPLIKMDSNHPGYVWAGGENTIFQPYLLISTDNGDSWNPADPPYEGDNAVYTLVAHPDNPDRILIGMEGQILASTDGGQNYTTSISFEDGTYITAMKQHPQQQQTLYASGSQAGTAGGNLFVYQSNNFGQSWQLHEDTATPGPFFINDLEVRENGNDVTIFLATNKGVYRLE